MNGVLFYNLLLVALVNKKDTAFQRNLKDYMKTYYKIDEFICDKVSLCKLYLDFNKNTRLLTHTYYWILIFDIAIALYIF